ncbi:MAG TPA: hypothetical protein VN520_13895 [Streptomyces sp.]|uniref:hypothetical protein n=1 Tax=Streptomyces sp. TaxID=1931 RepID=UPI002C90FDBC|nr:hypothetical protein [Streptomyces sp.]HWU07448.1 hypothetical protein [Streptomyces sp.]
MTTDTDLQRACDAAVRAARTDGERAAVHSLNPPGWPNVAPGSVLGWYADALWELARRAGRAAGPPETGAVALSEWVTAHSAGLCTPATLRTLMPWLADEPTEFLERATVGTQDFCAKVMRQAAASTREAAEKGAFGVVVSDMTATTTMLAMLSCLAALEGIVVS